MRSGVPRAAALFVVASAVTLSLAGSAGAGSATLRVGDVISIGGSKSVGCVVSGGPTSLTCGQGLLGKTVPLRGYGVVISKDRAAIVQFTRSKDRIVLFRDQPAAGGKIFASVAKRGRQVFYLQSGDRILLGGSDIACAVAKAAGRPFISCFPTTPKFDPVAKSWGVGFSGHIAALLRYDSAGNVTKTIVRKN